MFRHNFHTHTLYCDGKAPPEEYILAALDNGLLSLGFSGHSPLPLENGFAIQDEKSLQDYCSDIQALREKYRDRIPIFLGLEADYIPGDTDPFDLYRQKCPLDYIIGSVHLVKNPEGKLWFTDGPDRQIWLNGLLIDYNGDVKKAVGDFYRQTMEMIINEKPDVVGHLDKIKMHNHDEYFREDEPWYVDHVMGVLEIIRKAGCIVEVNTRGIYSGRCDSFYPGPWILKEMHRMSIPVTISTDAHRPEEVGLLLDEAATILKEAGYKEAFIIGEEGWRGISL